VEANERMDFAELEQQMRDAFSRWNQDDRDPDPERVHPDVEILSASAVVSGQAYHGYDGFRRWIADLSEAFDEWTLELVEVEELAQGHALGVGSVHFRGRGSGAVIDLDCAWLFDYDDDGRLTRLEAFPNRVDEARAIAAGG
jgi:ketosteroid isomerase-like protein